MGPTWEVSNNFIMMKVFAVSCLLALAGAAPAPDADADAQFLAAAPYHAVPAANCVTEVEVLVTQTCVPTAENVCTTQTVDTEEIEYEKVCKEVVDTICDAPVAAHAVAHSVTATVKHACREVTTEHCVDNPKVKLVPVEVEHCHTVTKVTCTDVNNEIPKTTCEAVETTHVSHAAYAAPIAHAAYGLGY